ncbi:MAG: chorismate mutase [Pseudomonadota bacterium]
MTITELRAQIDQLDYQLIEILSQRFAITHQIGQLKATQQLAPRATEREAEQFARYQALAENFDVPPSLIHGIFHAIIDQVVEHHQQLRSPGDTACKPPR